MQRPQRGGLPPGADGKHHQIRPPFQAGQQAMPAGLDEEKGKRR